MKNLKLPNSFILIFALLVMIAAMTWIIPGGKYESHVIDGKTLIDPQSFHQVASTPQGLSALFKAPIKGFVESALIIGFILIVGGAFSVLQRTDAINALIKALAKAHTNSKFVRAAIIPVFVLLFSLGGATFGMAEETIPFILIFVPLSLALGYDSIIGVSIPFIGSQAGFAAAFLNPFNVGIAQGISGLQIFSGIEYRFFVWVVITLAVIFYLQWYANRIKRFPQKSPTFKMDQQKREKLHLEKFHDFEGMTITHKLVLGSFFLTLGVMVVGVVSYHWYIEEIAALFFVMAILVGLMGRLNGDEFIAAFIHGAKDLVGTALIIALARGTVILAQEGHIIDTMLHSLAPFVQSSSAVFSAQKMFLIQSVINFFIHSGSGQAALTMPIMAPLADLVGVTRQTAVLAFQFGELSTPLIPTSAIAIGALALANIPWVTWAKWIIPLQLILTALALLLLIPPCLFNWQ